MNASGVFDRDGHLRRDLLDHFDIRVAEGIRSAAREIERAESAAAIRKRNAQNRLQTFGPQQLDDLAIVCIEFGCLAPSRCGLRRSRGPRERRRAGSPFRA